MADTLQRTSPAPLTEDAFLADRQRFWRGITHFMVIVVATIVVILILLTIFVV